MTPKERAAMQQALDALEELHYSSGTVVAERMYESATAALREALAEQAVCKECDTKQAQIDRLMLEYCPEEMTAEQTQEWGSNQRPAEQAEQEPVEFEGDAWIGNTLLPEGTPLYAAPVRTKDLTDDEIDAAIKKCNTTNTYKYFRAVIAADREKNK